MPKSYNDGAGIHTKLEAQSKKYNHRAFYCKKTKQDCSKCPSKNCPYADEEEYREYDD